MSTNKNDKVINELKRISAENDGVLLPADVVESARPESSPLHDKFTWDDSVAGHEYRLWQARQLIRVTVTWEERVQADVRVFVSLTTDRENEGGGYREVADVMRSKTHREQMLDDALSELAVFERKYSKLQELAGLFEQIRILTGKKSKRTNKKGTH